MAIIVNLDVMLAKRKMSVTELAQQIGITMANISILKNGRARAIRFSTLEAICAALDCQPGDLLEYRAEADSGDAADPLVEEPHSMR
jgi:putative transcriptional regulator